MKWIKALNLQQWADSIPAKVIFPALIAVNRPGNPGD